MPSSRPMGPRPSFVVALTLIWSVAMARWWAKLFRISPMWGLSFGRSATTTTSTLITSQPNPRTRAITWWRRSRLSASFQRDSSGGKCWPMSPRLKAPRRASIRACAKTSASLWPSSPNPSGWSRRMPARIKGLPVTSR